MGVRTTLGPLHGTRSFLPCLYPIFLDRVSGRLSGIKRGDRWNSIPPFSGLNSRLIESRYKERSMKLKSLPGYILAVKRRSPGRMCRMCRTIVR